MWRRADSPWALAGLAALAYGFFVLARLAHLGGDPSVFVVAGEPLTNRDVAGPHLQVLSGLPGFDGQFFYRLAVDPFTSERTAYGVTLDTPAYRQQRILLPLAAWAASGGRPERIPVALILVNWAAVIVIGWCAGRLAQTAQQHAATGALLAFYPGFLFTVSRDLAEVVEFAALLTALVLLRRRRPAPGAVALTLALLARETALLAAIAVAGAGVARRVLARTRARVPLWAGALPVLVWSGWQATLCARWGVVPVTAAPNNLGWPFVGVSRAVGGWVSTVGPYDRFQLRLFGYLVAMVLAAAVSVHRSRALDHEKIAWVLYGALAAFSGLDVWVADWGFMRGVAGLCIFSGVILLGARRTQLAVVAAAATVVLWGVVALDLIKRL